MMHNVMHITHTHTHTHRYAHAHAHTHAHAHAHAHAHLSWRCPRRHGSWDQGECIAFEYLVVCMTCVVVSIHMCDVHLSYLSKHARIHTHTRAHARTHAQDERQCCVVVYNLKYLFAPSIFVSNFKDLFCNQRMVVWFENFWNTRGSFVIFSFDCFQDFVRQITLLPIAHGMRASAYVICMCACVWVCVYLYMQTYIYIYIYIYTCIYFYIYIHICIYIYIYMYISLYNYIHRFTYITNTCVYIYIHTYI